MNQNDSNGLNFEHGNAVENVRRIRLSEGGAYSHWIAGRCPWRYSERDTTSAGIPGQDRQGPGFRRYSNFNFVDGHACRHFQCSAFEFTLN